MNSAVMTYIEKQEAPMNWIAHAMKKLRNRAKPIKVGDHVRIENHASPAYCGREGEVFRIRGSYALVLVNTGEAYYNVWISKRGIRAL